MAKVRSVMTATVAAALALTLAVPSAAYPRPGVTELISRSSAGAQGAPNENAVPEPSLIGWGPSISANGRYVAFWSSSGNLVPGDINFAADVFLRDRTTGTTRIVSEGLGGVPAVGICGGQKGVEQGSEYPSISADGRYVAFESCASNLVAGDTDTARDIFVWDRLSGTIQRASISSAGGQTPIGTESDYPSISADGRHVAFESTASNLVPHDTNGFKDVFVRDLEAHRTRLVSTIGSHQGNSDSSYPSISATGRYVVFDSGASNFVPDQKSIGNRVFRKDMATGALLQVNVASDGTPGVDTPGITASSGNIESGGWDVSADGRYVVFRSSDTNLVPNDTNRGADGFVHDFKTGRTERVTVSSWGGQGDSNGPGNAISISPDGRFVVFSDDATNWFPGGSVTTSAPFSSKSLDQYSYDRRDGALHWLTVGRGETQPPNTIDPRCGHQPDSGGSMSADGRFIAFSSCRSDLVPHDANLNWWDTFVRDIGPSLGVGTLVSGGRLRVAGRSTFSSAGLVAASDPGGDLNTALAAGGADLIGASLAYRPQFGDVFVREELRSMPSVSGTPLVGNPGVLYGLDLTADGTRYEVRVQRVPGPAYDAGGGASFGLFRRGADGLWTKVADLRGGYGTTGEEVVVSLPLLDLGLQSGGRLTRVAAFTALGTFEAGPVRLLDRVGFKGSRS